MSVEQNIISDAPFDVQVSWQVRIDFFSSYKQTQISSNVPEVGLSFGSCGGLLNILTDKTIVKTGAAISPVLTSKKR